MSQSTATGSGRKSSNGRAKPPKDFPLWVHPSGRYAKKIRQRVHYFGKVADGWRPALERWLGVRDDLLAGRTPRVKGDGLTVADLANRFLTSKKQQLDAGEIVPCTWQDYFRTCERVISVFGKRRLVSDLDSSDFEHLRAQIAKTYGPVALGNEIQRIRVLFKYGYDAALFDAPIRYGPGFRRPAKRVLRKARNAAAPRMFDSHEIRAILDAAPTHLKAMIYLGVNCGFGNSDCGTLPISALDLERGWATFPRPKTGIARRAPLWPETVDALHATLDSRPTPRAASDADLVFVTKYGKPWAKPTSSDNPISKEMRKLLHRLGITRKGVGFYALRHVFETIGGESRDQVAVDAIMGHADQTMAGVYRERISDERLKAVTDHVHSWLFNDDGEAA